MFKRTQSTLRGDRHGFLLKKSQILTKRHNCCKGLQIRAPSLGEEAKFPLLGGEGHILACACQSCGVLKRGSCEEEEYWQLLQSLPRGSGEVTSET